MNSKAWYTSKELWLVFLGVANYFLNRWSLPSFEPTPEFYTSLVVVLGVLRAFFTEARIAWK
jgi:hypothetical protein